MVHYMEGHGVSTEATEEYTVKMIDPNGNIHSVAKVKFPTKFMKSIKGITSMSANAQGVSVGASASIRMMGCTYVNEMPVGVDATYDGYLLYDLETELYAGYKGEWSERSRNILVDGFHMDLPTGNKKGWNPRFSLMDTLDILHMGTEVVMVPCKSHESRIGEDLFVYQEFDWRWAVVVKSRSGVLPVMMP